MPAKAACEVKTRTVRQPQKNGDIYVIERQTRYKPVKKYNVALLSRIVGKRELTSDLMPGLCYDRTELSDCEVHRSG